MGLKFFYEIAMRLKEVAALFALFRIADLVAIAEAAQLHKGIVEALIAKAQIADTIVRIDITKVEGLQKQLLFLAIQMGPTVSSNVFHI